MTPTSPQPHDDAGDAPLSNFLNCHDGILQHLKTMEALPELSEAADRARKVAEDTRYFFRNVIYNHHEEEERVLFEAVLASANEGAELDQIKSLTDRLTREHRKIEAQYLKLEPDLKKMAKGQAARLDTVAMAALLRDYRAHATFEETEFLPLSHAILSRNSNHMAALGLSLHVRHITQQPSPL